MGRKKAANKEKSPKLKASELIDRDLAARALEKRRSGRTPTARETEALKRVERQREEEQRWEFYRSIPQKHWREMSGRQRKVIVQQAETYGIPFGGKVINLPSVVRALHDFLARHHRKLLAEDEGGIFIGVRDSPALEEMRKYKAALLRLDYQERRGTLCNVAEMRIFIDRVADLIRDLGQQLQKLPDPEAYMIFDAMLDNIDSLIFDQFSDSHDGVEQRCDLVEETI